VDETWRKNNFGCGHVAIFTTLLCMEDQVVSTLSDRPGESSVGEGGSGGYYNYMCHYNGKA